MNKGSQRKLKEKTFTGFFNYFEMIPQESKETNLSVQKQLEKFDKTIINLHLEQNSYMDVVIKTTKQILFIAGLIDNFSGEKMK